MEFLLPAVIALGGMGIISAIILYFVSKKFEVQDDPRITEIQALLPSANCGGCGYPGCSGFAAACTQAASLDGLLCPVGGTETMNRIATVLGYSAVACEPRVAVVRCNGSCEKRPHTNQYDGTGNCAIASALYGGETGCPYGCLGWGDCVTACLFDAIRIHPETRLPEVDETRCTACGACVKACPKQLIELRRKSSGFHRTVKPDDADTLHRIYVACMNRDKGGVARKACSAACIGCSKCLKNCESEAIVIANNLAYIDDSKCTLCGRCVSECPTASIVEYLQTKEIVC
ncbi:MAG: RnfABCDGE type electron transport complex subunit B [Dysgonamonadaceae bacterium]|nr:RnfABCDGE type electron transport complex subunit B [Dysgonamonadaceae bacterium]